MVTSSSSAKTYWSILKTFVSGWKVSVIPPLLINNEFICNFKTKANYFNRFFNQHCTAISIEIPHSALLTIYHFFTRPHLDYGDVIYDQPENESSSSKIKSVQYNASLAITGGIRGTSQEALYQELGLESLR